MKDYKLAWLKRLSIILFLILHLQAIRPLLPEAERVIYAAYLLLFAALATFLLLKDRSKQKYHFILVTSILIIALIPISAWQAKVVFDQPLIYGILAERDKLNIFTPLIIFYLLEKKVITLKDFEFSLLATGLFYFLFCLSLYLFFDPSIFEGSNFVHMSNLKGIRYKLETSIVILLYCYSLISLNNKRSAIKFVLILVTIIFYVLFLHKARAVFISLIATTIIFILLSKNNRKQLLVGSIAVVISVGFMAYVFFEKDTVSLFNIFKAPFEITLGSADNVKDYSTISRIKQLKIALPRFIEHPWFGNGRLSSQWNNGMRGLFLHFYPSDIGWIGLLYMYGIVGFVILKAPFLAIYIMNKRVFKENRDSVYNSMIIFSIFLFIFSIIAGFEINKIGITSIPMFTVWYYSTIPKPNSCF